MGTWTNTPGNARNGTASHKPTCWSTATYDYAVVTRHDWHVVVWRRPVSGGEWESYDVSGTVIGLVNVEDSHYAVAIGVDHLERVWISGNSHADTHLVIVSDPYSITSWNTATMPAFLSPHSMQSTYHKYDCFPDGQLLWTWDSIPAGPATGMGRDWIMLRMNMLTNEWEPCLGDGRIMMVDDPGTSDDELPNRSYLMGHHVDTSGRLHITFVWRETSGGFSMDRLCYAYSDDRGATWQNIEGYPVTTPFYFDVATVEAGIKTAGDQWLGCTTGGDVCIDNNGFPVISGWNDDGDWYFWCRWNGSAWVKGSFNWPGMVSPPTMHLRYDGALIVTYWRETDGLVVATNFDEGPSSQDTRVLGRATIGTPDGEYTWESSATYYSAPAAATYSPYRQALQWMIPDGDTPTIQRIGAGPVNNPQA